MKSRMSIRLALFLAILGLIPLLLFLHSGIGNHPGEVAELVAAHLRG